MEWEVAVPVKSSGCRYLPWALVPIPLRYCTFLSDNKTTGSDLTPKHRVLCNYERCPFKVEV